MYWSIADVWFSHVFANHSPTRSSWVSQTLRWQICSSAAVPAWLSRYLRCLGRDRTGEPTHLPFMSGMWIYVIGGVENQSEEGQITRVLGGCTDLVYIDTVIHLETMTNHDKSCAIHLQKLPWQILEYLWTHRIWSVLLARTFQFGGPFIGHSCHDQS